MAREEGTQVKTRAHPLPNLGNYLHFELLQLIRLNQYWDQGEQLLESDEGGVCLRGPNKESEGESGEGCHYLAVIPNEAAVEISKPQELL